MNTRGLFFVILTLCIVANVVESVDRAKFKKCNQSGFCKRNRDYAAQTTKEAPYSIKPETVESTDTSFKAVLTNRETEDDFNLLIENYGESVVRVRITEPEQKRYEVVDVIMDDAKPVPSKTPSTSELLFGKVKIHQTPFSLDFGLGADTAIKANNRGFFNIEAHQTREEEEEEVGVEIPNGEEGEEEQVEEEEEEEEESNYKAMSDEDAWEESFSSHTDSKPRGPTSIGMDFSFINFQHVFGIPEHATDFALQPTIKGFKKEDPFRLYNLDVFEYETDETMALYGAIPFMVGHSAKQTVGLLWLNAAETWIDVEVEDGKDDTHTHWFSESGIVDFFIVLGPTPRDVMKQYGQLTGYTQLPPKFSIAYHQCRWNYKDEEDVSEVNAKFDEFDMPYDVIWLDIEHTNGKRYFTWDTAKFPTPERMQNEIASKGRRMVNIVDPHIKRDDGYHIHSGASANGLYVKQKDGTSDYEGWCWPGSSMYLDFTAANVREWWAEQFSYSNYKGSTDRLFIWNDMNEPSVFNGPEVTMQKDLVHAGGWEHRDVHNQFGYYVHMATAQGLINRNPSKNERPFVLSRAFFAGSQRYGAIWTGDNDASWEHLQYSVPMLLSCNIAGMAFSGADVGGFFGNPEEQLLVRWYQAGAYQPFFRGHAHLDAKRREPYLFSDESTNIIREALRSRYQLLPYWYTLFYEASVDGIPVMRPLWFEFPTVEETFGIDNEYLVGSNILVKPISVRDANGADVLFPPGVWYDILTHQKAYSGSSSGSRYVDAPLSKIPVYQRGGSIIPRKQRARRSTTQMVEDPYTLVVALDNSDNAEGVIYVDDGSTFNYAHKNEFIYRKFVFNNGKLTSKQLSGSKSMFPGSSALIEKIAIVGLDRVPVTAKLSHNNSKSTLTMFVDHTKSLIIKKPNVSISDDWSITLQF